MTEPQWLQQPEITKLLNLLVDKLDKAQLQGRAMQSLKLDGRTFPALFNAEFEADKENYWSQLEQMQAWGWFNIKTNRPQQGMAGYELNPRLHIIDEAAIRNTTARLEPVKSAQQQWREAVFGMLRADDAVKDSVAKQKLEIPGKTAEEMVERLNLLPLLTDEPLLLREVSARLFWGQSKVLDKRQALIAAILSLDECPFPEAPIQLQVFLPTDDFDGVLFIENLVSFDRATRDVNRYFAGLALVFASGFKGTAKRLRLETGASVYFAAHGSPAAAASRRFLNWLFAGSEELPVWFWGDLDYSGMQILKSLRNSFDGLEAWQLGYQSMLDEILAGNGHAPEEAGKSKQKSLEITGSAYADQHLLPAIAKTGKFLDQEFLYSKNWREE
ncbi:MAG: Wadjet anti-phage system protein JetD domain-containing protein [Methylobacter sp.]